MHVEPNPGTPPAAAIATTPQDALPPGTRFGEFEISQALGVGGFGIVYLAHDHALDRPVALKEYMPALLAARGRGALVMIRSQDHAETYASGLRAFINEARLLARFDHPALVKVYRVWEDNGTAYMVMPYLAGRTLRELRRAMAAPPDEAWIRRTIAPVLEALEELHAQGVYHRDIAPDNIVVSPDGVPVLLDFGAARRAIGEGVQSFTAIVKPSYAPIEQYAEMASLRQGPWTDLYAFGAVLHFLLFGVPPAPAVARALQPDAEPIEARLVPGVSAGFLHAVAWMLAVRPADRPQRVADLRAVLDGEAALPPLVRGAVTVPAAWAALPRSELPDDGQRTTVPSFVRPRAAGPETTVGPGLYPQPPGTAPAVHVPGAVVAATRPSPPATHTSLHLRPAAPSTPPAVAPEPAAAAFRRRRLAIPGGRRAMAGVGAAVCGAALLWAFVGVIERGRPAVGPLTARAVAPAARTGAAIAPAPTVMATTVPVAASRPGPAVALAEPNGAPAPAAAPVAAAALAAAAAPAAALASDTANAGALGPSPSPAAAATSPWLAARNPSRAALARRAPLRGTADGRLLATAPASARDACSAHHFIAYALCVDHACEQPRFRASADCARMIADKRRREDL